jgi:hypothetical protein
MNARELLKRYKRIFNLQNGKPKINFSDNFKTKEGSTNLNNPLAVIRSPLPGLHLELKSGGEEFE